MESRINKELDELVNEGYEIHIVKDKSKNTILISDTFKIELSNDYPFKEPYIYISLNNGKYITISQIKYLMSKKNILDTYLKEDIDNLKIIIEKFNNFSRYNYSPSVRILSYVKNLDYLSNKFFYLDIKSFK